MHLFAKVAISALLIALVSELAKRSTVLAAILVSLPLISILSLIWVWRETASEQKIIELASGIFWACLPSLLFFVVLPFCLKAGLKFGWAMTASSMTMFLGYTIYVFILGKFGIKV